VKRRRGEDTPRVAGRENSSMPGSTFLKKNHPYIKGGFSFFSIAEDELLKVYFLEQI
jgi:hypothetical protein